MSETEQQRFEITGLTKRALWTDPTVKLITSGAPFRRWLGVLRGLVDECKMHFTEDGITVKAVDPANVGSVHLTWAPHGMGVYRFNGDDHITVGVNLDTLEDFASFARIPQDDPISVHVAPREPGETIGDADVSYLGCRVTRPDQRVQRSTALPTIDPDSIRQEPDLDLAFEKQVYRANVNASGFSAALAATKKLSDHTIISVDGSTLVMRTETDAAGTDTFNFPDTADPIGDDAEEVRSKFSLGHLTGMAGRLKVLGVEEVEVRLGDGFPVTLRIDHEEWGLKGGYSLAPRIQS